MASLAMMANGSTADRGPYAKEIRSALNFVIREATRSQSGKVASGEGIGYGPLYDHACTTLFLSEILGTLNDASEDLTVIKEKLKRAVAYLSKQQHQDGGWGEGESTASDISTTAAAWLALRSAHKAGLEVSASLERVEGFVRKCAIPSGGYNHAPNQSSGMTFYPTSSGLRIMYGMGKWDDEQVQRSTDQVLRRNIGADHGGRISEWDYCAAFYATTAFIQVEHSPTWQRWFRKTRDLLMKKQNSDGRWTIEYCKTCPAYATALALIILQSPNRLLPMLQL